MKKTLVLGAVLACGVHLAHAEQLGDFAYNVPEGWEDCRCKTPGADYNGPDGAKIQIRTGAGGDARTNALAALKSAGSTKTLNEAEAGVGGRNGWIAVGQAKGNRLAVAATGSDDGGVTVLLISAQTAYEDNIQAWGALVDTSQLGGGSSSSYQDQGYGGSDTPTTYTVTLKNNSGGCAAQVTFDGQAYSIPSGSQKQIQVDAGSHTFSALDDRGERFEGTWDVPDFGLFNGWCGAEKPTRNQTPREEPREEPTSDDSGVDEQALVQGAQYYVLNVMFFTNIAAGDDLYQPTQADYDKMVPKLLEAGRKDARSRDMILAMPQLYEEVRTKLNSGLSEDNMTMLILECAQLVHVMTNGTWINTSSTCAESNDGRECAVIGLRAALSSLRDAKARLKKVQQMQAQMSMDMLFNISNTMNQTSMNIINNI